MDGVIAQEADEIEELGLPDEHDTNGIHNRILGLWHRAPNWHTITELNRRFLEGRLLYCPSYNLPVEIETDDFSGLLRLHDYGLISTCSCPGGEQDHTRQRAFLFFSLPTHNLRTTSPNALSDFVSALAESPAVYAHIRFQYYNAPNEVERDPVISGLMRSGSYGNIPTINSDVWIEEGWTYDRDDRNYACSFNFIQAQDLDDLEDTGHYRIPTCGSNFRDDENPIPASHAADPLQISVVARDWNYSDIGRLVQNLMDQSGILPEYRRY